MQVVSPALEDDPASQGKQVDRRPSTKPGGQMKRRRPVFIMGIIAYLEY